jgi:hypothetical protein
MTIERVAHTGALVVTALVNWEGVKWYESSTYYGYNIRDAKRSYRESCKRLGYTIVKE